MSDETACLSCGEDPSPMDPCPISERPCGHHCNHIWTHDCCHWCNGEFIDGEDGSVWWVAPGHSAIQVQE